MQPEIRVRKFRLKRGRAALPRVAREAHHAYRSDCVCVECRRYARRRGL